MGLLRKAARFLEVFVPTGNSLPIVYRELRVTSRHWITYWSRTIVASILLVFALGLLAGYSGRRWAISTVGQDIFATLSVLAFIFSMLGGVVYTADCLSEEKRE